MSRKSQQHSQQQQKPAPVKQAAQSTRQPAAEGPVPPTAEELAAVVGELQRCKKDRDDVEQRYAAMLEEAGRDLTNLQRAYKVLEQERGSLVARLNAISDDVQEGMEAFLDVRAGTARGFWRAGMHFDRGGTLVPIKGTDPKVIEMLSTEARLSVRRVLLPIKE